MSRAVEFRSYRAGRIDQANNERFRGLALVKPRRLEPSHDTPWSEDIFSDRETRHNFDQRAQEATSK
jgi:hypothetical protein